MNDLVPKKPKAMGIKRKGADKIAKIAVNVVETQAEILRKPKWIRAPMPLGEEVSQMKSLMRQQKLHSVCEEASCPNLGECFRHGTASFMIMGDICTRRCPFCDVAHGRPNALDVDEPLNLAQTIANLKLRHVVITSVDRDDLPDGGARHFAQCVQAIRQRSPEVSVEILTPDFRGRSRRALEILCEHPPDIFNHNMETVARLYAVTRPGANYDNSLNLLLEFKEMNRKKTVSKSGIMVGLGETFDEIVGVMQDLRAHKVDMLTIGQYLRPSKYHLAVKRYYTPEEFKSFQDIGIKMGFAHVASAPLVRSSYHADRAAQVTLP